MHNLLIDSHSLPSFCTSLVGSYSIYFAFRASFFSNTSFNNASFSSYSSVSIPFGNRFQSSLCFNLSTFSETENSFIIIISICTSVIFSASSRSISFLKTSIKCCLPTQLFSSSTALRFSSSDCLCAWTNLAISLLFSGSFNYYSSSSSFMNCCDIVRNFIEAS